MGPPGMLLNDLPDRALRRERIHIALTASAFSVFVQALHIFKTYFDDYDSDVIVC